MEDRRPLAPRFIDALHRLEDGTAADVEPLVELFSAEARLLNSALEQTGREVRGRDGARTFWTDFRSLFEGVRSEFHQVTVNEAPAGLFWTTRGTYADGAPLEYDGASLLVFDAEGSIHEFRGYYDTRELTREVAARQSA